MIGRWLVVIHKLWQCNSHIFVIPMQHLCHEYHVVYHFYCIVTSVVPLFAPVVDALCCWNSAWSQSMSCLVRPREGTLLLDLFLFCLSAHAWWQRHQLSNGGQLIFNSCNSFHIAWLQYYSQYSVMYTGPVLPRLEACLICIAYPPLLGPENVGLTYWIWQCGNDYT